jgi:hypothetical protein
MTKKIHERKFGEIPEWATKGDVTLENYDLRVEAHGIKMGWKDNWPFLSHIEAIPSTANAGAWDLYFRDVLGGFPKTYQNYRDGVTNAINLPEKHPGDFDARFYRLKDAALADQEPEPPARPNPWKDILSGERPEDRVKVAQRILRQVQEAFATHRYEPYNVFVPTFAPQYKAMVAAGGRPGVSLEDSARQGVWVPLRWLTELSKRTPKKETPESVRAKLGISQEQWDAIPNAPSDTWKQAGT